MKVTASVLLCLLFCCVGLGQALPKQPFKVKRVDKKFLLITSVHGGVTLADGFTTRIFVRNGYEEVNPISRFVLGPTPSWNRMAPVGTLYVGGTAGLALYLKSKHKWYWWVPQAACIGAHVYAVRRNVRLM